MNGCHRSHGISEGAKFERVHYNKLNTEMQEFRIQRSFSLLVNRNSIEFRIVVCSTKDNSSFNSEDATSSCFRAMVPEVLESGGLAGKKAGEPISAGMEAV